LKVIDHLVDLGVEVWDNIKTGVKETDRDVGWIYLNCVRPQWQALFGLIMNFVAVTEGGESVREFLDQPSDYRVHVNAVMLLSLFLFSFTFRVALFTCPFFHSSLHSFCIASILPFFLLFPSLSLAV
jgi:hypothetical protein